ncbi:hypothetical protein AYK24_02975 [Thermoplasmatales archaeon SG8-52-4]|nr:MAG: hypothetical protein AYK24_02975 [Thermoplasmatales archaeon SG8-52-4]
MKKNKVFIYSVLTCNRRKIDAWKIKQYFIKNNFIIVENPNYADIIFIITCAYSNKHSEESLKNVKKFIDYKAELIISGCLPDIDKEKLKEIFNGKIIPINNLNQIDKFFPQNKIKLNELTDANFPLENINQPILIMNLKKIFTKSNSIRRLYNSISESILKNMINEKSCCHKFMINYSNFKHFKELFQPNLSIYKNSFFIRPSWGCLGNCSYCVIKKAIGPLKSKPLKDIIFEFNKGLNQGYKNFIFDADDLGAYGIDIGINFTEMLDKITDISGDYSIHLRYVHPVWIVKYNNSFDKIIKKGKIISIGSAIQSGNPRILSLMHRFSDIDKIKKSFSIIKNANPGIYLSTECINGFPTETFEEFNDTLTAIKEINFDWGFIFPFSSRPKSEAENINPKVSDKKITIRMKYAFQYLKKIDYNCGFFKNHNILVFSKTNSVLKLNKETRAFCFSTIE